MNALLSRGSPLLIQQNYLPAAALHSILIRMNTIRYKSTKVKIPPTVKLNSGHTMPRVGLGTFQGKHEADTKLATNIVGEAIKLGYRLIDSAYCYGSEVGIGEGIRNALQEKYVKSRDELFIISKERNTCVYNDYVDMYLIHWPCSLQYVESKNPAKPDIWPLDPKTDEILFDNDADYVDTWKGMEDCVKAGLVKSIGVSNFREHQIQRILDCCSVQPSILQTELHPFLQDFKLVDFCKKNDIFVQGYSSFLKGESFNDYHQHHNVLDVRDPIFTMSSLTMYWTDTSSDKVTTSVLEHPLIKAISEWHGRSPGNVILRFFIQQGIGVIPKTVQTHRLKKNLDLFRWSLTEHEMESIRTLDRNLKIVWIPQLAGSKFYPFKEKSK